MSAKVFWLFVALLLTMMTMYLIFAMWPDAYASDPVLEEDNPCQVEEDEFCSGIKEAHKLYECLRNTQRLGETEHKADIDQQVGSECSAYIDMITEGLEVCGSQALREACVMSRLAATTVPLKHGPYPFNEQPSKCLWRWKDDSSLVHPLASATVVPDGPAWAL
eukprot:gene4640-4840_t